MKYYHVSATRWPVEEVTRLQAPDPETRGYGERDLPRLSVATTVCQCLYATPGDDEVFHIYEVMVKDPILPEEDEDHYVSDLEHSGERWVVQRHLDDAPDNKIAVKYLGWVPRTTDIHGHLKTFFQMKKQKMTSEEEDCLWDKADGEWEPLFREGSGKMQKLIEAWRKS